MISKFGILSRKLAVGLGAVHQTVNPHAAPARPQQQSFWQLRFCLGGLREGFLSQNASLILE